MLLFVVPAAIAMVVYSEFINYIKIEENYNYIQDLNDKIKGSGYNIKAEEGEVLLPMIALVLGFVISLLWGVYCGL